MPEERGRDRSPVRLASRWRRARSPGHGRTACTTGGTDCRSMARTDRPGRARCPGRGSAGIRSDPVRCLETQGRRVAADSRPAVATGRPAHRAERAGRHGSGARFAGTPHVAITGRAPGTRAADRRTRTGAPAGNGTRSAGRRTRTGTRANPSPGRNRHPNRRPRGRHRHPHRCSLAPAAGCSPSFWW